MSDSEPVRPRLNPFLRGALGGLCWGLPFGVLSGWLCLRESPTLDPLIAAGIGLAVVVIWALSAGLAEWGRSRQPAPTARERVVQEEVARAAWGATLFSTPVVLFTIWATLYYGPGKAVLTGAMLQGIWVGSAAMVGLIRGKMRASKMPEEPR